MSLPADEVKRSTQVTVGVRQQTLAIDLLFAGG
ncbi:MAG: hypothetical protein RI906_3560, partial [Pseudomonadota bacterium]